jgi:hypothetical protein
MLFDLQLKCVVSDGLTPAPVLPVVALIWTSVFNNPLLQAVIKANCIAVAKHPGFAMYSAFLILALVQANHKQDLPLNFLSFVNLKSFPKSIILV